MNTQITKSYRYVTWYTDRHFLYPSTERYIGGNPVNGHWIPLNFPSFFNCFQESCLHPIGRLAGRHNSLWVDDASKFSKQALNPSTPRYGGGAPPTPNARICSGHGIPVNESWTLSHISSEQLDGLALGRHLTLYWPLLWDLRHFSWPSMDS